MRCWALGGDAAKAPRTRPDVSASEDIVAAKGNEWALNQLEAGSGHGGSDSREAGDGEGLVRVRAVHVVRVL